MAKRVLADWVKESTSTTGTGAYVLGGATGRFFAFSDVLADDEETLYSVSSEDLLDTEWGVGTFDLGAGTLARTKVLGSSNGGNAVNWAAGNKDIRITLPSQFVGSMVKSVRSVTAGVTLGVNDSGTLLLVDASGGAVTQNLPAGSTAFAGFTVHLMKTDTSANAVTVDGSGAEAINGAPVDLIGARFTFQSYIWTGTEWSRSGNRVRQVGSNGVAPHQNLRVSRPTAASVRVQADWLLLTDVSGQQRAVSGVDVTIALTTAGAAGLDTGSEANSTWYYAWILCKDDGTVSGVLSASSSTPTLPSGYVFRGLVSAAYNGAGGDLDAYSQVSNKIRRHDLSTTALNAGTATTYTAVSLAAFIPPIAASVRFLGAVASTSSAACSGFFVSAGTGTTPDGDFGVLTNPGGTTNGLQSPVDLLLTVPQEMKYRAGGTGAQVSISPSGFDL